MIRSLLLILALAAASPALAQERSPVERQALVALARILGESHAIRRVCEGAEDQFWRGRMQSVLDQEAADQGLKTRLSVAFNDGFHAGQALYPKCSDAARAEARRIAASGQKLAEGLEGPG